MPINVTCDAIDLDLYAINMICVCGHHIRLPGYGLFSCSECDRRYRVTINILEFVEDVKQAVEQNVEQNEEQQ